MVSRLPTVFLAKKLSKYRLKQPKYIVLGTPKKPEKIPKNDQNRFWVIKQCFLGKIRGEKIFTQEIFSAIFRFFEGGGVWGVTKIFYPSSAFRICTGCLPKYERNLLKISSKNTYFHVFQGFRSFFGFLVILGQKSQFGSFWPKWKKWWKLFKQARDAGSFD